MDGYFNIKSLDLETDIPSDIDKFRSMNEKLFFEKNNKLEFDQKKIIGMIEKGEVEIAKKHLVSIIDSEISDDNALIIMAEISILMEEYKEVDYWLNLIKYNNKNSIRVNNIREFLQSRTLIEDLKYKKKWNIASKEIEIILEYWPENKYALKNAAKISSMNLDFDVSSKYWLKLIRINCISLENVEECCISLYKCKKFEEINKLISSNNWLREINNKTKNIYVKVLYNLNKIDQCILVCEEIIKIEEHGEFEVKYLINCLIKKGDIPRAIRFLKESLDNNLKIFMIYNKLVECYLRIDMNKEIEKLWDKLFFESHKDWDIFFITLELAISFNWKKRYDEIIERNVSKDNYYYKNGTCNIFDRISRIFLQYGIISESLKYANKIKDSNNTEEIFYKIDEILAITNTNMADIQAMIYSGEDVFITELVLAEILRRQKEKIKFNNNKVSCFLVTSTLNRGGAERQVMLTANGINSKKIDCKLVVHNLDSKSNKKTYLEDYENKDNLIKLNLLNVNDEEQQGYEVIKGNYELLGLLDGTIEKKVKQLILSFSMNEPDIVHAWQDETIITSSMASALVGVPILIGSARSLRPDKKTQLHIRNRPYLKNCYKLLLKNKWFTLSVNSDAGRKSYSEWLGIPETKIRVIKNGIDFKKMKSKINKKIVNYELTKIGITKNNLIVGGLFRLESGKRPGLWIDSVEMANKKNKNIRGILVGDGKMSNALKVEIKNRDLDKFITLVGEKKDVGGWLSIMDVFLITSESEGLPNVTIEAQRFGIPVVATDAGGMKETFIQGETGLLSQSEMPKDIAKLIVKILDYPGIKKMKTKATKNAIRQFSTKNMIHETKKMYNDMALYNELK